MTLSHANTDTPALQRRIMRFCLAALLWFALVCGVGIAFPPEAALQSPLNQDACATLQQDGLPPEICQHREFANSAWKDSYQYFRIAMGKQSIPPYSLRPLVPKAIGAIARLTLPPDRQDDTSLFKRISQLATLFNLLWAALLVALPALFFHDLFLAEPALAAIATLFNLVTVGVLQTSPFFMLDTVSYVVFTAGAIAFFRSNLPTLCLAATLGIFVKEIAIVMLVPIAFLAWKEQRYLAGLLFMLPPILAFVGIRHFAQVDPLSVQYGWNLSHGDIRANYLAMHLGSLKAVLVFISELMAALAGPLVAAVLLRPPQGDDKPWFAIVMALTVAVIAADALLASRVPRIVGVATPFLVIYMLAGLERKNWRAA